MRYFPAFLNLDNKKVLLIGGGNIAYKKLLKLLDFTNSIDIIAKDYSSKMIDKIKTECLKYERRIYTKGDIANYDIVIIAIDDISIQAEIFKESKDYKCLCNAVDSVEYCDFIFPSYIKQDDLTIAISTSGASPAVAKHLKYYLQNLMPHNIGIFLQEMKSLRKNLQKGKNRMKILDEKAKKYFINLNRE